MFKKHLAENHTDVAWVYVHLGIVDMFLGKHIEAKALFSKSLAIYKEHFGNDNLEVAWVIRYLGKIHFLENDIQNAEKQLYKALEIYQKNTHSDAYMVLEDLSEISLKKSIQSAIKGDVSHAQHFKIQAISYLQKALEIVKTHFPTDSLHIERIQNKIKTIPNFYNSHINSY